MEWECKWKNVKIEKRTKQYKMTNVENDTKEKNVINEKKILIIKK